MSNDLFGNDLFGEFKKISKINLQQIKYLAVLRYSRVGNAQLILGQIVIFWKPPKYNSRQIFLFYSNLWCFCIQIHSRWLCPITVVMFQIHSSWLCLITVVMFQIHSRWPIIFFDTRGLWLPSGRRTWSVVRIPSKCEAFSLENDAEYWW